MKKIFVKSPRKIKSNLSKISRKINVSFQLRGNILSIIGSELNEFITGKIIECIDFGFDFEDAILLRNEDFSIEYVNIKDHTHRKNLAEIRSRIIGTHGKAKKSIENLTGSILCINGNKVGIIADSEHVEQTIQAVISVVQGSKHGNVFSYLERQNANLRKIDIEDLGLRNPKKDLSNL